MPVFIDPNQPPLPVPEHSASADGILNAWVLNSEGACTPYCATYCDRHNRTEGNEFIAPGVYLEADFSSRGYGNLVADPGFVDPARNAVRFPSSWPNSDGEVEIAGPYVPEKVTATNLFTDPGYEYGIAGITVASGATMAPDTAQKHSGAQSLKVTTNTVQGNQGSKSFTGKAGKTYIFSAWVFSTTAITDTTTRHIAIGNTAATGSAIARATGAVPANTWTQVSCSIACVADGTINMYWYGTMTAAAVKWFDDMGLTDGAAPVDFNGGTAASGGSAYRWTGAPGSSSSEKYTPATNSDSYRVWLVGDRLAAASSSAPAGTAPDNGAFPVSAGDVLTLSIIATSNQVYREARWQIARYDAAGAYISGAVWVTSDTALQPGEATEMRGSYTVEDGTAYVAVAFVVEGTYNTGTVTISEPSVSFAAYDTNPLIGVRFYRINADGTKVAVRGADFAYAVGGKALAYDQEAPLGQASQWIACPVFYDGTEGECSQAVAVTVPWPEGCMDTWIKPVNDPDLTMVVQMIEPFPEFTRAARNNLSEIQSSKYRAGSWDLRLSWEATFTFYTPDRYERQRIIDALSVGPILLQSNPEYLIPEEFCLPGDLQEVYTNTQTMTDPGRTWTVTLTTIARPATQDSPSAIPGRTYRDTNAKAGTYRMREQVFPLYIDATRPMGVAMTEIAEATQP